MYLGTYKQKKVIKLAPDVVILINGSRYITICPKCGSKMDLTSYVSTVGTNLANNCTVGTATFSLAMPRHGHYGHYMVRGGILFGLNLMDEVEIYFKSRFPNVNGVHTYYKSFWGVITDLAEAYSEGIQTINVSCQSILRWFQLIKTNEHPSAFAIQNTDFRIDNLSSFYTAKTFANLNPYQMMYMLVNLSFLNIVIPTALDTEKDSVSIGETFLSETSGQNILLLNKWKDKFANIKASLKMFGTTEDSFIEIQNTKVEELLTQEFEGAAASKDPISPIKILYDTSALMDFRPYFKPDEYKQMDIIANTYKNNLEIANEVKNFIGFEFYMDTNGEIVFKPPFWNLDTKQNIIYVLEDSDILNWDFTESEAEVLTRMEVVGSIALEYNVSSVANPRACFTRYDLAEQFGLRSEQIQMRFFTSVDMCYYHAISELDRINANRFKGSITIVGRPELKLAYPIYIRSRDCYVYVDNISHNFTVGGPFTTQIQYSAMRRKYIGKRMSDLEFQKYGANSKSMGFRGGARLLKFNKYKQSDLWKLGYTPKQLAELENKTPIISTSIEKQVNNTVGDVSTFFRTNRAGEYTEIDLASAEGLAVLRKFQTAKKNGDSDAYLKLLDEALPVSDDNGYSLIGIYENGKSIYLDSNMKLKRKPLNLSTITVELQDAVKSAVNDITGKSKDKNLLEKAAIAGEAALKFMDDLAIEDPKKGIYSETQKQQALENFYTNASKSLSELSPSTVKNTKTCNCHDPVLMGSETIDNTLIQSYASTKDFNK